MQKRSSSSPALTTASGRPMRLAKVHSLGLIVVTAGAQLDTVHLCACSRHAACYTAFTWILIWDLGRASCPNSGTIPGADSQLCQRRLSQRTQLFVPTPGVTLPCSSSSSSFGVLWQSSNWKVRKLHRSETTKASTPRLKYNKLTPRASSRAGTEAFCSCPCPGRECGQQPSLASGHC